MRKIFIFLFLVFCAIACGSRPNVELIPAEKRQTPPEIKATFFNAPSENLTLEKLKGKVIILDFWATWCGPCRMELPDLVKLYDQYHAQGLELLGLSVEVNDNKSKDYFDKFMASFNINYPMGLAAVETIQSYGIRPIPTTFLIDKNGKVAMTFVGAHPFADFEAAVDKLLKEKI